VIDGAQDFCHVQTDLRDDCCDLYLAGCHKWLGAYQPLGLAFYGRRRSQGLIETVLAESLESADLDDPMLSFVEQHCRHDSGQIHGETINLSSLFSCQAAVSEASLASEQGVEEMLLRARQSNAEIVAAIGVENGWTARRPHKTLQTGILLLQAEREATRLKEPAELRSAFQDQATALTAYENGLARLSLPSSPLSPEELEVLQVALERVA